MRLAISLTVSAQGLDQSTLMWVADHAVLPLHCQNCAFFDPICFIFGRNLALFVAFCILFGSVALRLTINLLNHPLNHPLNHLVNHLECY